MTRTIACMVVALAIAAVCLGAPAKAPIKATAEEPDGGAGKVNFGASKVTMKVKDMLLADIFDELARQTGNLPVRLSVPDEVKNSRLSLDLKDMSYWQAMSTICNRLELIHGQNWYRRKDHRAVMVQVREANKRVGLFAGPVMLDLKSAYLLHQYLVGSGLKTHLAYTFSYFWEDRLPVVSAQVLLTRVVAPGGKAMKFRPICEGSVHRWNDGIQSRIGSGGSAKMRIENPPEGLKEIAELEGVVKLELGGGSKTLQVKNIFSKGEKTDKLDNLSLKTVGVYRRKDLAVLVFQGTQDGKRITGPDPPQHDDYGYFLVDSDGKRYSGKRLAPVWGTQIFLKDGEKVGKWFVPIKDRWILAGHAGGSSQTVFHRDKHLIVVFRKLVEKKGAWSFDCVLPGKTVTKSYPFKVTHLPRP